MSDLNISSANASAILVVNDLYPAGIVLEMFSTDQAITQEKISIAEVRMGVDGKLVAGYMPGLFNVTVTLEAASPSSKSLALVWNSMRARKTVYDCSLVVTIPGIRQIYTWSAGVMKAGTPFPGLKKTLEPTSWEFSFQEMNPVSY